MSNRLIAMLAVCAVLVAGSSAFAQTPVDLELSLVVDNSSSISASEFNLQMTGYANAFTNPSIVSDINSLSNGLAINMIFFGTTAWEGIGWQHVGNGGITPADFSALITVIASNRSAINGQTGGLTNIAAGIKTSAEGFGSNGFTSSNQIIDVSGDGFQNTDLSGSFINTGAIANQILQNERDAALAIVDRINGLAIGSSSLTNYFNANVIGGPDSFVTSASSFSAFATAVDQKIEAEIQQAIVPVPGAAVAGLVMLGGIAMRRRRAA